jgi:hypothetical protein
MTGTAATVGWYSGAAELTGWPASLFLSRALFCVGVVIVTTLQNLTYRHSQMAFAVTLLAAAA